MNKKIHICYRICIIVLALIAVSLAITDLIYGLNEWLLIADNVILGIFIADYLIRLILAKRKIDFIKHNVFDLIAIIPFSSFFRAFRIARLSRLLKVARFSRVTAYILRFTKKVKISFRANGFKYVLTLSCILILIGGFVIHYAEDMSLLDGFWWSFVTTTTVGYGDISPNTGFGRFVAIILMITGIGLIGTLTSTLTSFFLNLNPRHTYKSDTIDFLKKQLDNMDNLSDEDIDHICGILKTFKKTDKSSELS